MTELHNPADMPDLTLVDHLEEPRIKATILVPDEYLGAVLKLCQDRRGIQLDLSYAGNRAMVVYDLPLNEVVFDFYDRLKSSPPATRASTTRSPATARTTSSRCPSSSTTSPWMRCP
jgi:translation elongation factor EF-4